MNGKEPQPGETEKVEDRTTPEREPPPRHRPLWTRLRQTGLGLLALLAVVPIVLILVNHQPTPRDEWGRKPATNCLDLPMMGWCGGDTEAEAVRVLGHPLVWNNFHCFSLFFGPLLALVLLLLAPPYRRRGWTERVGMALVCLSPAMIAFLLLSGLVTLVCDVTGLQLDGFGWFHGDASITSEFLEESAKLAAVGLVMALLPISRRTPATVLALGMMCGFGFAGWENLDRIAEQLPGTCPERILLNRLPALFDHAVYGTTAVCGVAVWLRDRRRRWLALAVVMFLVGVVMHWTHNHSGFLHVHFSLRWTLPAPWPDRLIWLPLATTSPLMTVLFAAVPLSFLRAIRKDSASTETDVRRSLGLAAFIVLFGAVNFGLLWAMDTGLADRINHDYRDREDETQPLDHPPTGALSDEGYVALTDTEQPMEFLGIEGGEFTMGSRLGDGEFIEHPRHRISLSPFFIARTEVTQDQYLEVVGTNPSYHDEGGGLPVDSVSWCDAIRFANELSERESGMEAVYEVSEPDNEWEGCVVSWDRSKRGYRLPTEAEWEFAAGALDAALAGEGVSPSGNDPSSMAWFKSNAERITHEVAMLSPSDAGLYDMFGNVDEWVWDEFAPYDSGHAHDPVGPIANEDPWRIVKGGHALDKEKNLRVTRRARKIPTAQYRFDGLRLALSVLEEEPEIQAVDPGDEP